MMNSSPAYEAAVRFLTPQIEARLLAAPHNIRTGAVEIRLRSGRAPTVVTENEEFSVGGTEVLQSDLARCVEVASGGSIYSAKDQISRGYITLPGGHRLGVCGNCVLKNGRVETIRDFSSISLRIARDIGGIAAPVAPNLFKENEFLSTLIISPPGRGKTTLLRDLIRALSYGTQKTPSLRVSVADERGEIGARAASGGDFFDLGPCTDLLEGCPKDEGMLMLLRSMNPQVIAVDEITAREDIEAARQVQNCGVALVATIHASSVKDLASRPVLHELLSSGVFKKAVVIDILNGRRTYYTEDL